MGQIHATYRRRLYLSPRTEEAYRFWIRQYIFFHNKRYPQELREAEVTQFINYLAVQRKVSASTQTQAINAIVFLYRDVLAIPLGEIICLNRVHQRKRIPVVMTASEVAAVLSQMSGTKANSAARWCKHASDHAVEVGTKQWKYLLLPHVEINESKRLSDYLRFEVRR